jgi:hypothetical protein
MLQVFNSKLDGYTLRILRSFIPQVCSTRLPHRGDEQVLKLLLVVGCHDVDRLAIKVHTPKQTRLYNTLQRAGWAENILRQLLLQHLRR